MTVAVIIKIVAGVIGCLALGYLLWWGLHFADGARARRTAARARALWAVEWPPDLLEAVLEYARLLDPQSPAFAEICLALAQRSVDDRRACALYERYLAQHAVTVENAAVARGLAWLVAPEPPHERRAAEVGNAAALLDRLVELGVAKEDDVRRRARIARLWIDLSPQAVAACVRVWQEAPDGPEADELVRFLYDYFGAAWDQRAPGQRGDREFTANAARVFQVMADMPPAELGKRQRAIQAAFEIGDYLACFEQCARARDEFGAPALGPEVWSSWAQSIVCLEAEDWATYAQGKFAHLPPGTAWSRLQEVLDHAVEASPADDVLRTARVWTYLGGRAPMNRAVPVFASAFGQGLRIVPAEERLAEYYHGRADWKALEPIARALMPLQAKAGEVRTARYLAEALIEGNLAQDLGLFERVFDEGAEYPRLNERLAQHYLGSASLSSAQLARIERLLESPMPATTSSQQIQALRERYLLEWLGSNWPMPAAYDLIAEAYLEAGGAALKVLQWAADGGIGSPSRQIAVLEMLVDQRPVEYKYCRALMEKYGPKPPSSAAAARLTQAAESKWESRQSFDAGDCRLAAYVARHGALSDATRRKLVTGLLTHRPADWSALATEHLAELLQRNAADVELLKQAVSRLFKPQDLDPVHVLCLEKLMELRDEPVGDGLRLLALYDSGVARPGEDAEAARAKAAALAKQLAARCRQAPRLLRNDLFSSLIERTVKREALSLEPWEIDLVLFGIEANLFPAKPETNRLADQLASVLVARADPRALAAQRWVYDHSSPGVPGAARLFDVAHRLNLLEVENRFWLTVARHAKAQPEMAAPASDFLVTSLLAFKKWDDELAETAATLLQPPYRQRLAAAFVTRVAYGRHRSLDNKVLDLLHEDMTLGAGRAELLLALAERREKRHDYEGALAACLLIEESVGSSEDVARRILDLLPHSQTRAQQAGRLAGYLQRYRNSFDLLARMTTLARDSSRPLSFELAYAIVDRWGDLAARQDARDAGYASDPSFVATAKCEVYDLYHGFISPAEDRALLASIAKHSRQVLSPEAQKRIERIGEAVLDSTGQENETRKLVAEVLYGLGNLPAATWQLERLVEAPDFRADAVKALEQIAHRLEKPRREVPALLTAYRCVAMEAYRSGNLEAAEETTRKAKAILLDEKALEDLTLDDQKRVALQRDHVLKLHQALLETQGPEGSLSLDRKRDLADIYSLRGLWDKAGRVYSELAEALNKQGDRASALENGEAVFRCYYKAGKAWWDLAARWLVELLANGPNLPLPELVAKFSPTELRLMVDAAVLYHSLCVDPNLTLAPDRVYGFRRTALFLYERLPLEYIRKQDYLHKLQLDLQQTAPRILEPFELVPHIREQGRAELWSGHRYEKLDLLGKGFFADVFKVKDTQTNDLYAMKLITPAQGRDPKAVERFQREGVWLKELEHPNIVKCYDAGVQEDRQFIIMDYVEGQTLDKLISDRRLEIPLPARLQLFLQTCGAVEYLHHQGIIHRDLHPGNVLVGGAHLETVKLTDFGLATLMDRAGVGKSSRINGRENYTASEVGGDETAASDVFSLGAMLCFILTGYPRPDANLRRDLEAPEYLGLGEVIERALSLSPSARHQHVTELIQEVLQRAHLSYDYGAILQKVTPLRFRQMFELGPEIGRGDAGPVYRAHDQRRPGARDVAVKEIASSQIRGSLENRAEQFFRVRDLAHPNLVPLHTFFRVNGKLYVVMDLVEGQSLATAMEANETQGRRFPPDDSLGTIADVARALAFVHQNGIVHGCVVPTNVLLEETPRRARLSDFAASVLFDGDQWHKSARVRQYNYYLAPESEHSGAVTPRSDVYSLGWLLCHMVTGQRGMMNVGEIRGALDETGRWTDRQQTRLTDIITESTILEPARRAFKDGAEFLAALEGVH